MKSSPGSSGPGVGTVVAHDPHLDRSVGAAARSRACAAGPRASAPSRRRARSSRRPRRGSRRRASRSSSCFNAYGTGAALAMRQRIDDRSARASSPGGRLTIRLSCVGAENVFVTRCSFTSRSHDTGSNLRSTTTGHAHRVAHRGEGEWSRVVHRTGGEVDLLAEPEAELAEQREDGLGIGRRAQRALRLPRGARRVDHRRRRTSCGARRAARRRTDAGEHVVPGAKPGRARRHRTRRTRGPSGAVASPTRAAAPARRR